MLLNKDNWKVCKRNFLDVSTNEDWTHEESGIDWRYKKIDDYLIIHFQYTVTKADWKSNFTFFFKKIEPYKGVFVHQGIFEQYLGVRNKILDIVYNDPTIKHIRIGGYSQGGGFTYFCTQDLSYHFPDLDVLGIAYAPPRVFCWSKIVADTLKGKIIIVKNFWDIVVHVPFFFWGFKHYGKSTWIGKWWKIFPIQHLPSEIISALELYEKKHYR